LKKSIISKLVHCHCLQLIGLTVHLFEKQIYFYEATATYVPYRNIYTVP